MIRSINGITYRAILCLAMHFILFILYLVSIHHQTKEERLWLLYLGVEGGKKRTQWAKVIFPRLAQLGGHKELKFESRQG